MDDLERRLHVDMGREAWALAPLNPARAAFDPVGDWAVIAACVTATVRWDHPLVWVAGGAADRHPTARAADPAAHGLLVDRPGSLMDALVTSHTPPGELTQENPPC